MMDALKNRNVVIPMLMTVAFTAIGSSTIGYALYQRTMGNKSLSWATTQGEVIESRVESTSGDGTTFYPVIRYKYRVGAQKFESNRIRFANLGSSRGQISNELVDKFPVSSQPRVFYNPTSPGQAVLQPGTFQRTWWLLVAGVLFQLFAIICFRFGIRSAHQAHDPRPKFTVVGSRK